MEKRSADQFFGQLLLLRAVLYQRVQQKQPFHPFSGLFQLNGNFIRHRRPERPAAQAVRPFGLYAADIFDVAFGQLGYAADNAFPAEDIMGFHGVKGLVRRQFGRQRHIGFRAGIGRVYKNQRCFVALRIECVYHGKTVMAVQVLRLFAQGGVFKNQGGGNMFPEYVAYAQGKLRRA